MKTHALAVLVILACASIVQGEGNPSASIVYPEGTSGSGGGCEFEEIQLASDGTIEQRSLEIGERVTPNRTMNGTVDEDQYHFYHLCILRHEHEHQINVNLTTSRHGGDANLYLSSMEKYPRMGHASWISQHVGSDFVKLFTYLDGFPRKDDVQNRSIPLHIGVFGVDNGVSYNLTVSVLDLPVTGDIQSREKYYSKIHRASQAHNPTATSRRALRG